eukprot:2161323-Alexandrium_andersonii.AAC.1
MALYACVRVQEHWGECAIIHEFGGELGTKQRTPFRSTQGVVELAQAAHRHRASRIRLDPETPSMVPHSVRYRSLRKPRPMGNLDRRELEQNP